MTTPASQSGTISSDRAAHQGGRYPHSLIVAFKVSSMGVVLALLALATMPVLPSHWVAVTALFVLAVSLGTLSAVVAKASALTR